MSYAFIDNTNLHKGILSLGWRLDYKRFRVFLKDHYSVEKAYMFLGFVPNDPGLLALYRDLQNWGYTLVFKPTLARSDGTKGNCDAELVLQAMIDIEAYDHAVLVSGDGDFRCLVDYLRSRGKLRVVLSPSSAKCSVLLKKSGATITFLEELRSTLEYTGK